MSRFANLEFDDKKKAAIRTTEQGTPVRDATFFHEKAQEAYLAGDLEAALLNYSRSLEQNSAFFEGWFGQVRMLIEMGEYEEAMLWADKSLELFPEHPMLLAAKSVACCRTGALDKAMAFSDNALSGKGVSSYVWLARTEALLARKSPTAERCLNNAINVAGNASAFVRMEAGRTLLRAGRCVSAMEHLQQTVAELPKAALVWFELGRCQAALGLPEAEVTFAQCLMLHPRWNPAQAALERFRNRSIFARVKAGLRRLFGGRHGDH